MNGDPHRSGAPVKVVLASGNPGKLRELRELLVPCGFELVSQAELGIDSAPETGHTFIENALEKARHVCRESDLPTIADDSGLLVDALAGAPGIYSARYAGEAASDTENNRKLLTALAQTANRRAHFYCAVVFLRGEYDPAPVVSTACWHGRIVDEPRGSDGFGYDPHFYIDSLGRTAAELTPAEKSQLSHRGQAVHGLCRDLESRS
ncbi:MAG: RdgB/HAM1 family non-canonical purine NTP pyrophosphatase [Gammaproteobacteria bacterium]|nr:RdgB/HAM1 family non-canonical purine NTP pyrophosphatase [Gammaproteobacteria bacterium]